MQEKWFKFIIWLTNKKCEWTSYFDYIYTLRQNFYIYGTLLKGEVFVYFFSLKNHPYGSKKFMEKTWICRALRSKVTDIGRGRGISTKLWMITIFHCPAIAETRYSEEKNREPNALWLIKQIWLQIPWSSIHTTALPS